MTRDEILKEGRELREACIKFGDALESWIKVCEDNEEFVEELFENDPDFIDLDEELEDSGNRIGL